jgi:hypothetical protein
MTLSDRSVFALSYDMVRSLDLYLAQEGGVRLCPHSHEEWNAELYAVLGKAAYDAMSRLTDERRRFPASVQIEQEFFDLVARPPYDGVVWSPKRAHLLDGAVAVASLYRSLGLTGGIAEVGCYTGLVSLWLGRFLGVDVHGYDRSAVAIERAASRVTDRDPVSFTWLDYLLARPQPGHSLVFAADTHPRELKALRIFLRWIRASTSDQGLFVWIGNLAHDLRNIDIAALCAAAGFGYAGSSSIGGWLGDGVGYESKNLLVLRTGGEEPFPAERTQMFPDDWPVRFPPYANDPTVSWTEKTQAYFYARAGFAS